MNRITKINIFIFGILSLITIIINLLNYDDVESLSVVLMVLSFNICIGFLAILMINHFVIMSKRGFRVFICYLALVSFFYWYILSSLMYWYYGSFISIAGIYYFIATRTYFATIVFYLASGLIILSSSLFLLYFLRKHISEEVPKINISKKMITLFILIPVFVLIVVLIIIPKEKIPVSSPIIDIISQYVFSNVPDYDIIQDENETKKPKVFNFSLDIEKPNIIIIMLESISTEHIPYYGYERNITPNIDLLANKSAVFNNAYAAASHSDYAQTAFLSSKYALINPYRNFFNDDYPRIFIWDILKEQGNYTTAYISSQDDNWANMIRYYNTKNLDVYNYSLSDGKYDYGDGNAKKDYDEKTINNAIGWVNKTSSPFFLYLNLQANHYPYSYPENNSLFIPDNVSFQTSYFNIAEGDYNASLNRYDNALFYTDKQIGKLINFLKNKSLFDNSIIILSADHGETLEPRHGLRHGFGIYEEEVRVPLMIYIPNKEHRIIESGVKRLDVVPTILNISGFNLSKEFQGKIMTENPKTFLMVQNQNFKIGLIKDDIKYILDGINYIPEAYNLTEDALEQNNLIKTKDDEKEYYSKYGHILYKWYECQIDYYEEEKWINGEVIDC